MAQRRMLSNVICETDKFYALPHRQQALFMHLMLNADDEGFVRNPSMIVNALKKVTRRDLEELQSKGYVILFESGVLVMTHWLMANKIEPSKINNTGCVEEKKQIKEVNKIYIRKSNGYSQNDSDRWNDEQDWK